MTLFTNLANLFASVVQLSNKNKFTTVIYPSRGTAVVVHDGLEMRHESQWYQYPDSLIEEDVRMTSSFETYFGDHTGWAEPITQIQADGCSPLASCLGFMAETSWVNPANGMPMMDNCFDVMGSTYGRDIMSDYSSFDHGMDAFEDSVSSFGFD